jgi:hypothetical protein
VGGCVDGAQERPARFFFPLFFNISYVAIIKFSQIWLKTGYESKQVYDSFTFFIYIL